MARNVMLVRTDMENLIYALHLVRYVEVQAVLLPSKCHIVHETNSCTSFRQIDP